MPSRLAELIAALVAHIAQRRHWKNALDTMEISGESPEIGFYQWRRSNLWAAGTTGLTAHPKTAWLFQLSRPLDTSDRVLE